MLCEVNDAVVESLRNLKGEQLQLNYFNYRDYSREDGFVLSGGSDYFFIKSISKSFVDKYELHLLQLEQVWAGDVEEELRFEMIEEGELEEIHLFAHSLSNITVENHYVERVSSECAMMINFKEKSPLFIYPKVQVFGNSALEEDTDKILDIISTLQLHKTRTL